MKKPHAKKDCAQFGINLIFIAKKGYLNHPELVSSAKRRLSKCGDNNIENIENPKMVLPFKEKT